MAIADGSAPGDIPQRLGKYEIRRALGRGAMGVVYEAFDPVIERSVAIKTVALTAGDDPEAAEGLERFKREAQAAGRLTHPNIVGVYDYGETESLAYIVMEFVEGETLKSLLDRGERFALADTAAIMRALLDGLAYSHAQGVIHRDIKPANVMVTAGKRVKLADFGVARIESSSLTQAGTMIGTPAYMSPEQFMGQPVDARTDIYSTGVLLYQLLTGEKPFEGSLTSIMHKVLNTEPPRPSALAVAATPALDAAVAKAMAKRPDDRFATAAAFAAALDAAFAGDATTGTDAPEMGEATLVAPRGPASPHVPGDATRITASPAPSPPPSAASATGMAPPPPRNSGRTPLLAGAGVVALLLAGGGAWLATRGPAPHPRHTTRPAPASTSGTASSGAAPAAPAQSEHASSSTQVTSSKTPTPPAASTPATSTPAASPSATSTSAASTSATGATAAAGPQPAMSSPKTAAPKTATPKTATPKTGTGEAGGRPAAKTATATKSATAAPIQAPAGASAQGHATGKPAAASQAPAPSKPAAAPHAKVAASTIPAPPKPPATPSDAAIRAHLADAVRSVPCALLHGTITGQGRNASVHLAGLVGNTERGALKTALGAPPVPIATAIRGFSGPYCGLISAIRPYARLFPGSGAQAGGRLSLALANGATRLAAGKLIVIHLGLPDFPAYLQVDYVSSNGAIYPLYPGSAGQAARLSPGQHLVLGSPKTKGGPRWAVGPPFGRDMILAIAASRPIGAAPGANATVGSFLPKLRKALAALEQHGARTRTTGLLLDTVAK